jgi:hypothetical protein
MTVAAKNHIHSAAPEETNIQSFLTAAKQAKKDEFYTQWADIEREMNAYLEYDPDAFRDKVVMLPCDDPEWSNFTKFFALHFMDFGLKKLISTSLAADSKPGVAYHPTLFELGDPQFDETKTHINGKLFTLEAKDLNGDGVVDIDDLQWRYLEGDGDFRSDEITQLRDEADIVITNPPFSLFRQFIVWLTVGGVKFSIIGNQNAITYKEVFPLIKANQIWLGKGFPRNMAHFNTPYAPQSKWIEQKGDDVVRVPGVQWFTNIEHGRRHEPMQLMSMADNLKFNKKLIKWLDGKSEYQHYDNFDAIEIPFTDAIPSDYDGVMGVPVTWLAKHNPEQFEILFSADDMAQTEAAGVQPLGQKRVDDYYTAGGTGGNSKGHRKFFLYHPKPWVPYKRIAIRHRRDAS